MIEDLDKTIPYVPHSEVVSLPRRDAERIYLHYRGSGKNKRTYPNTLNQMLGDRMGFLRCFNPFILTLLQSPKEKGKRRHVHLSTPPLDRLGYRLPSLEDYSKKLIGHNDEFRRYTIDFGLVLRSIDQPNQVLAEDLADQIQAMYGEVRFPLLISLRGTFLKYLPGSNYDGFSFKITETTQVVHAPILNQPGFFSLGDLNKYTCLPKSTGDRTASRDLELITIHPTDYKPVTTGLSRAYINLYGDIDVGHPDLARVDRSSRLFVVRA
jgi:hypothetical protein